MYIKKQTFSISISETSENVCFYFMIGFPWRLYSHTVVFPRRGENSKYLRNIRTPNTKYLKIKISRKECHVKVV